MKNEIDLFFVPQWSPFQPPLSLPALSSWLSKENIKHRCFDVNILFYKWLFSKECSKLMILELEKTDFSFDEKLAYKAIFNNYDKFYNNVFEKGKNNLIDQSYISTRSLETYLHAISDVVKIFSITPYGFSFKENDLNIDVLSNYLSFPPEVIIKFIDFFLKKYILIDTIPEFIGISCIGQEQLYFTLLIGLKLKEISESKVIIGGTILNRMYNRGVIPKSWFYKYFDIIVKNEGEKPLLNIIKNNRYSEINGIIFHNGEEIIETQSDTPLQPSEIPIPNFEYMPLNDYISPQITLPILSSRGCYWGKCAFCHHGMVYGEKYSVYEINNLLEQIKFLSNKYGVNNFAFNDEAIPPKILRKMGEIFPKSSETQWSFTGLIKFEKYYTRNDFLKANQIGFKSLYVGLESGSERVLSLMQKNNTQEIMIKNLSDAYHSHIWVHCFVFFGFPGETNEDAQQTLDFIKNNKNIIGSVGCGTFSLEHDAPIQKNPEKYGVDIIFKSTNSLDVYYSYNTEKGINHNEAIIWMNRLNDIIYSTDKFSSTNWIPREHQLILLQNHSQDELVKWSININNNYGFPCGEILSNFIVEEEYTDYSILTSTIFRVVLKVSGNYKDAFKIIKNININKLDHTSKKILSKFYSKDFKISHTSTSKVI